MGEETGESGEIFDAKQMNMRTLRRCGRFNAQKFDLCYRANNMATGELCK